MSDYVPVYKPGDDITFTAGSAITGGQLVVLSAANTVVPSSAASALWVGVALQDAASGASVVVSTAGVHEVKVASAVAAGDAIMTAATGQVATFSGTTWSQQIGIALTAQAVAASTCRVLFR